MKNSYGTIYLLIRQSGRARETQYPAPSYENIRRLCLSSVVTQYPSSRIYAPCPVMRTLSYIYRYSAAAAAAEEKKRATMPLWQFNFTAHQVHARYIEATLMSYSADLLGRRAVHYDLMYPICRCIRGAGVWKCVGLIRAVFLDAAISHYTVGCGIEAFLAGMKDQK